LGHLRRVKVDIFHAHEAKAARWAWIENVLRKTPYIITRRVPNTIKKTTKMVYRNASAVIAISEAIKDILFAFEPSLKTTVIPSASSAISTDQSQVAYIRKTFAGKKIIGNIGALVDRHKGQSYIIEAARALNRSDLAFVFLGEGKDEAALKKLANGLDNVHFLGFKNNVADYIAAFDLFLFPSLQEGLGSILIDVMRIGTPIIASNVDGIPELITHNKTGFLVAPKDADAIKRAIETMLAIDTGAIIKAAQEKSLYFLPENMAAKYAELYRSIIENLQI
jgi:glycosyltransferase involved in cell wall biosynthesis